MSVTKVLFCGGLALGGATGVAYLGAKCYGYYCRRAELLCKKDEEIKKIRELLHQRNQDIQNSAELLHQKNEEIKKSAERLLAKDEELSSAKEEMKKMKDEIEKLSSVKEETKKMKDEIKDLSSVNEEIKKKMAKIEGLSGVIEEMKDENKALRKEKQRSQLEISRLERDKQSLKEKCRASHVSRQALVDVEVQSNQKQDTIMLLKGKLAAAEDKIKKLEAHQLLAAKGEAEGKPRTTLRSRPVPLAPTGSPSPATPQIGEDDAEPAASIPPTTQSASRDGGKEED